MQPNSKHNSTRSIRPPNQRIVKGPSAQNTSEPSSEGLPEPVRRKSVAQRPLSMHIPSTSANVKEPSTASIPRSTSPTKLPLGSHQRTVSTRQALATPSTKISSVNDRQMGLGKMPNLRRPSEPATLVTKLTINDSKGAPGNSSKRQISPSRLPSQSASNLKTGVPNVTTRSSSIVTRNAIKVHETTGERRTKQGATATPSERPGFNTNQQKSFAKRASPQDASNEPAHGQYSREALESSLDLLHRHLLHRGSARVQREWFDSAKSNFSKQFNTLVDFNEDLNEREKDSIEQVNAVAIMSWGHSGGDSIDRKIRILSSAITEASELTENNGKYAIALQAFEHWHESAQDIQRRRLDRRANRADVIEGLGDGWKADVESLQSRVIQISNDVLSLGDVQTQSDLSRGVTALSEMLMNMLEELEMMQFIEDLLVEQEQFWVQTSIDRIASDLRNALPD